MLRDKARKLPEGSRPRPSLLKEQWPEALSVLLKKKASLRLGCKGLLRRAPSPGHTAVAAQIPKGRRGLGEAKAS